MPIVSPQFTVSTMPLESISEHPFQQNTDIANAYVKQDAGVVTIGLAAQSHLQCVTFEGSAFPVLLGTGATPKEDGDCMPCPGPLPDRIDFTFKVDPCDTSFVAPSTDCLVQSLIPCNVYCGVSEECLHSVYCVGPLRYHFIVPISQLIFTHGLETPRRLIN